MDLNECQSIFQKIRKQPQTQKRFMQFSQNIDGDFQTKRFTGRLELIQLYKQNPLENTFSFYSVQALT